MVQEVIKPSLSRVWGWFIGLKEVCVGQRASFRVVNQTKRKKAWGAQGTKFNYQNLVSIFVTENDKLLGNSIKYCNSNCIWIKFIFESSQVSACCSLMKWVYILCFFPLQFPAFSIKISSCVIYQVIFNYKKTCYYSTRVLSVSIK